MERQPIQPRDRAGLIALAIVGVTLTACVTSCNSAWVPPTPAVAFINACNSGGGRAPECAAIYAQAARGR